MKNKDFINLFSNLSINVAFLNDKSLGKRKWNHFRAKENNKRNNLGTFSFLSVTYMVVFTIFSCL